MNSRKSGIWWMLVLAIFLSILSIRFGIFSESVRIDLDLSGSLDVPVVSSAVTNGTNATIRPGVKSASAFVSANHPQARPHPHAGARYPDGTWGFVANVTFVKHFVTNRYQQLLASNPTLTSRESHLYWHDDEEFLSACQAAPREGKERKAGWRLLTRKVTVDGPDPQVDPNQTREYFPRASMSQRTPRVLCAIYSYAIHRDQITGVAETWGWKCDGFFAASTETIPQTFDIHQTRLDGLGSIDLPHLGTEMYDNMWQKTRSILSYMHDNYLNDFDFFFLSGDDTFLIVENLRRMLRWLGDAAWEQPLYLGHWVPYGSNGNYFCGGGPGYVLNRKTLELFVRDALPTCNAHLETSSEDRIVGQCLRTIGIVGNHSVDAAGAQRFHGWDPHDVCSKQGDSGYMKRLYEFWGQHYGFRWGFNVTSSQSVSFHMLKTSKHLKRIHAILYKSCPPNTTIGNVLGQPPP